MKLTRYKTGELVSMVRGLGTTATCWQEPQEFFILRGKHDRIIAQGSVNSTVFLSEKYGSGEGIKATDKQIIDAIITDESVFAQLVGMEFARVQEYLKGGEGNEM